MKETVKFILLSIWLTVMIAVLITNIVNVEPVEITKTVLVQDDTAVKLLSDIMGRDCSDITVFEMRVTATAYTAVKGECDSTPEVTANMTPSRIGLLALSRDLLEFIPMGSRVIIPELGVFQVDNKPIADVYEVADKMDKRFKRCVDILHANKKAARLFGKKEVTLLWLK